MGGRGTEGWGRGTRERRAGGWENTAVKTYVVVVVVWVGGVWVAGSMILGVVVRLFSVTDFG